MAATTRSNKRAVGPVRGGEDQEEWIDRNDCIYAEEPPNNNTLQHHVLDRIDDEQHVVEIRRLRRSSHSFLTSPDNQLRQSPPHRRSQGTYREQANPNVPQLTPQSSAVAVGVRLDGFADQHQNVDALGARSTISDVLDQGMRTTQQMESRPGYGYTSEEQIEWVVDHVEEGRRSHHLTEVEFATGLDDLIRNEPEYRDFPLNDHHYQQQQQYLPPMFRNPSAPRLTRHHHQQATLVRPGAVSVRVGGRNTDDQSVDTRSTVSSITSNMVVIRPPLEPFPAYTVPEELDGESQSGDENLPNMQDLRDELQQIGEAVDGITGTLNNFVRAQVAEDTNQIQQRLDDDDDDEQPDRKHSQMILVILGCVFLSCVGVAVVLIVVRPGSGSPATSQGGSNATSPITTKQGDGSRLSTATPTISPTAYSDSPTLSPTNRRGGDSCFSGRDELLQAIDRFLLRNDTGPNSTLVETYGLPMNTWCVGNVQDFSSLFNSDRNPLAVDFNEDISLWDVSNAMDMQDMFHGAVSFNGDISTWDVSNVIRMRRMFRNTTFAGDISAWSVSRVGGFEGMFAYSEFNGNISGWDVSSAERMNSMFEHTNRFNQDLSNWDVSNVENVQFAFNEAASFNGDVSTWDVSKVISMAGMFRNSAFAGNISTWNVSKVEWFGAMFSGTDFDSDVSDWDVSSARIMTSMFQHMDNFNQDVSSWDMSGVEDAAYMFLNATKFNSDVSRWNVASLTNATMMFSGTAFEGGDLSGWDVSRVTVCTNMFLKAESFNGNITTWDVSMVTDMQSMFKGARSFNQDLSSWDVSGVVNFNQQFAGASSFRQDLCPWGEHVRYDADVTEMFINTECENVEDPNIGASVGGSFCFSCDTSS